VLRERPDGTTRLLVRERYVYTQRWAPLLVEPVEAVSFVMSQKMLRGIRDRAERKRSEPERMSPQGISLIRQEVEMANRQFSRDEARAIGERIGINWEAGKVDLEQFRMGLGVELEHGTLDPSTDVTHDEEVTTGKIALAHLHEIPDYYTRLAAMERDADASS